MKNYEKPQFQICKFEMESIMNGSMIPQPTPGSGFKDENELPGVKPKANITD